MVNERILARRINPVKAIAVSFLAIILLGTVLLMMPFSSRDAKPTGLMDALFTATSATTVTGLVVKDTNDHYSTAGQIIILALIQIGGLGYMTLMSFLFMFGRNLRLAGSVYFHESMNLPSIGDVYKFAKRTIAFVALFEALGALVLFLTWKSGMGTATAAKYGIFHATSAFNNAGFDLFGGFNSLASSISSPVVNATVIILTIVGGIGFIVMNELLQKLKNSRYRLSLHTKVAIAMTVILLVVGSVAFFALEKNNAEKDLSPPDAAMAAVFHSAVARTSGFATLPLAGFGTLTLAMIGALMFIGSSPGGTGGGVKTTTIFVAARTMVSFVQGKADVEAFNRRIGGLAIIKSFATITAAVAVIAAATTAMSIAERHNYAKITFEAISAFSTTGLSTGITPELTSTSKLVLIAVMFIGRVGPLALLHLLMAGKTTAKTRLPEEGVLVG